MQDCLFCKIVRGEIPGDILYQDEEILAFRDIDPKAPVHILIIPKGHIASAAELTAADGPLLGRIFDCAAQLAESEGLANGWRIVSNVGKDGGQSVAHLHFHLLGGRALGWPPG